MLSLDKILWGTQPEFNNQFIPIWLIHIKGNQFSKFSKLNFIVQLNLKLKINIKIFKFRMIVSKF